MRSTGDAGSEWTLLDIDMYAPVVYPNASHTGAVLDLRKISP